MSRRWCVGVCLAAGLLLAGVAQAEHYKYGPYPNFKEVKMTAGFFLLPTTAEVGLIDPWGREYTIEEHGGQEVEVTIPVAVFAASYLEFESSEGDPWNPDTDDLILTEIWAKDLDETGPPDVVPPMEGFYPGLPQIVPQGPGYFEGISGVQYPASFLDTVPIMDLASMPEMAGYDVGMFTGDPGNVVHVVQGVVPGSDFAHQFEFEYNYVGYTNIGGDYPYQHEWMLNIMEWDPAISYVSDLDIEGPHVYPGYVEVIPPADWSVGPWYIGRYSYEANPGNEITAGGGTYGWVVNAKTPVVEPGYALLTQDGNRVSRRMPTMVVAGDDPACGDWGYLAGDVNHDCKVNLVDLAMTASDWLRCTVPDQAGCVMAGDTIIGLGFAFNGLSGDPARVLYMYEDYNVGILEAGDEILAYRGQPVYSGAGLVSTIDSLPAMTISESVPLTVVRDGVQIDVYGTAYELPATLSETGSCVGKRCVRTVFSGGGSWQDEAMCDCTTLTPQYQWCIATHSRSKDAAGKVVRIVSNCGDAGGNTCSEVAVGN